MAAIIFDFDGTIADSFDYIVDFLAKEAGLPVPDVEQKKQLRGKSMAAIGRQFGHSWWRLLRLFFKGRRHMHIVMKNVHPFSGMPETIEQLHAEGHELFVVSSNTVRNIHHFLHQYNLHTYFLEVYGGSSLFGKAPMLRRLLKEQNIDKENALYIGDELRDVQAAQSIDLRVIGVTWGFAKPADIKRLKPTAVAEQPKDLIRILEDL